MRIPAYIAMLMLLTSPFRPGFRILHGSTMRHEDPECLECHQTLLEKKVVHEVAADACDNCHLSNGAPHPGDTAGFTLMDRLPDLCFYCHEGPYEVTHAHQPVEEGACLDCHDVHASDEYRLLVKPETDLCLDCHDGSGTAQESTSNIRRLITGSRKPHSAIEGGGCISCHLPHGAEQRALLVAPYPEGTYAPAEVDSFELCFLCHDADLMAAEETEWATGFRNGTRNLHHLHMHGPKGRNCRLCHNLHGSPLQNLIEEQVPFGSWQMELRFEPAENGGSCQPGCHQKEGYERE